MYHVLIADDHLDQRSLLKFLFAQRNETYCIFEAANGREALQLIEEKKIDLLITDVQMPFATGIELAEALRKSNNDIPLLFISGYDDFNYAKKALDLKAINYLLKPIRPEEFHQQIDLLIERLEEQHASKRMAQQIIQQDTLIRLFNGLPFEKLSTSAQKIALPIVEKTRYLMTIDVSNHEAARLDKYLQSYATQEAIFVRTDLSRFVGILYTTAFHEALLQQREFQLRVQHDLAIEATTEISEPILHPSDIYPTYQQLDKKIKQDFYQTSTPVTSETSLPTQTTLMETTILNTLTQAIVRQDDSGLDTQVHTLLADYQQAASESPSIVKFFFATLYRTMIQTAELDSAEHQQALQTILEATTFSQIIPVFEHLLVQIKQRFQNLNKTTNDYVREIKNYILDHYAEEINLDILAKNVHLAPKYLSDLFKREENIGVTKYLNEVRMEKAKNLLITSHHRVHEISQLVGFNSHSYFIRSFQKYTGLTPEKFRKSKGLMTHDS